MCQDPGRLQAEASLRFSSDVFPGSVAWGLRFSPLSVSPSIAIHPQTLQGGALRRQEGAAGTPSSLQEARLSREVTHGGPKENTSVIVGSKLTLEHGWELKRHEGHQVGMLDVGREITSMAMLLPSGMSCHGPWKCVLTPEGQDHRSHMEGVQAGPGDAGADLGRGQWWGEGKMRPGEAN